MRTVPKTRSNSRPTLAIDSAKVRNVTSPPPRSFVGWGVVGHSDPVTELPEATPQYVRIEQGQVWVEVTVMPSGDQVIARLAQPKAAAGSGWYIPLEFGCRVALEFVNGNPQNAVIVGRFHDSENLMPDAVAGVQTLAGAASAPKVSIPAPMWQFMKTAIGELLAIETGVGGDVLIHSAASVEIKAAPTGAIHLSGRVALGESVSAPPVGQTAGPAGVVTPGVPAVPNVPIPASPGEPVPPKTIVPYTGFDDGIIRAKDRTQSHAGVDPDFWIFITAVAAHPLIAAALASAGITVPIACHSEHSGTGGPGSQHTASD